jgi:hypothetical protein
VTAGEFAVAGPNSQLVAGAEGVVRVYNGFDKSLIYSIQGPPSGKFGTCLRSTPDLDGDGRRDLLVGAPTYYVTSGGEGLVRLFSGASGGFLREIPGVQGNGSFGTSISADRDLDGDGAADFLIGAPNSLNLQIGGAGSVRAFSGQSSALLFEVRGTNSGANLGISCALLDDVDGDSQPDLLAGSLGEVYGGAGSILSSAPGLPQAYCSSKINSLGCVPMIHWSGTPSIAATDDFHLRASSVLSNKQGIMIYGLQAQAVPFFGGTLCVYMIVSRTSALHSGGNPPPSDCTGSYDFHFSRALMAAGILLARPSTCSSGRATVGSRHPTTSADRCSASRSGHSRLWPGAAASREVPAQLARTRLVASPTLR